MRTPNKQLREAILERITKSANKISWEVTGYPKQDSKTPFVVLGEVLRSEDSAKTQPGHRCMVRFYFYSVENTWADIEAMENDVMKSLTLSNDKDPAYSPLIMPNFIVGHCEQEDSTQFQAEDARRGVLDIVYDLKEKI